MNAAALSVDDGSAAHDVIGLGAGRGPTAGDPSLAASLHHLSVVTPEGVVLEFRAAGVGSRMLAKGLDLMIQFTALIAAIFFAAFAAVINEAVGIVAIIILVFLIFYGYPALLETWWGGRTIGKKAFGIRVITTEGGPVTLRHAAIRSMISTFDFWFPTPGGLVALSLALLTKRSQRLGDLAAGTIVIREPKARQAPVFFAPAYGAESFGGTLDTSGLGAHHYTLIREFLLRVHELQPEARLELGERLATAVASLTGNARPGGLDAERYLVSILFAHQGRFATTGISPPAPVFAGPAQGHNQGHNQGRGPGQALTPPPPTRPADHLRNLPPPSGPPLGFGR